MAASLADGKPTASFDQRSEILGAVNGMAVKADQLLALKKEEGREFIAGKRLVYIYHNEIDARGDTAATEGDTFEAVRKDDPENWLISFAMLSIISTPTMWLSRRTTVFCSQKRRRAIQTGVS